METFLYPYTLLVPFGEDKGYPPEGNKETRPLNTNLLDNNKQHVNTLIKPHQLIKLKKMKRTRQMKSYSRE